MPSPNGSTELTLDNKGLEEEEGTHTGIWDWAARNPTEKWGCRVSLVWELGKKGSGEELSY